MAHYLMGEGGGGTVYDISGHQWRGTLTGTGNAWVYGQRGRALDFNGSDDYVDFPDAQQVIPDGSFFTISAWVFADVTPPANCSIYAKNYSSSVSGLAYELGVNSSDRVVARTGNGTTTITDAASGLSVGGWTFALSRFNGAEVHAYVDGAPGPSPTTNDLSGTVPSGNAGASEVIGAGYEGGAAYFNGVISDIRAYTRALSNSEILSLYYDPFLEFRWALEHPRVRYSMPSAAAPAGPKVGSLASQGAGL